MYQPHHPTLQTEELLLRPFALEDAPEVFRLNGDPEVMAFLPKDEVYTSVAEATTFLKQYILKSGEELFARQAMIRKTDGAWLGWCGLREQPGGEVDLGFRLHRRYWGNGYATAASKAWLAYGFETAMLDRIVANAAINNIGSQRTLEKLGFLRVPEGDHEEYGFHWLKYEVIG